MLSNFALVKSVDLVLRLWPEAACTTEAVRAEYQRGADAGLVPAGVWDELPIVELEERESEFSEEFATRIGMGERTCIAVAKQRGGLFVSDDAQARAIAREHRIPVSGTIGLLVRAVRRGLISRDEANTLLTSMIAAGYRSPAEKLDQWLPVEN